MKRLFGIAMVVCLMVLLALPVSAHYLWIDAHPDTDVGEEFTFHVFWGHIGDDELAPIDVDRVNVFARLPDGTVEPVEVETRDDCLSGTIGMHQGGDYQIYVERTPSVYRGTLHYMSAKAIVDVMALEEIQAWDMALGLPLEIVPLQAIDHLHPGDEVAGLVLFQGDPLPGVDVQLISEINPEEEIVVVTDENGQFAITLRDDGEQALVVSHTLSEPGTAYGVEYEAIGHTHTLFLEPHGH